MNENLFFKAKNIYTLDGCQLHFSFKRPSKHDKLKREYNRSIDKQKKNLNSQLELLNSQFKNNLIDQLTYERHKAILEFHSSVAQDIKHAEEALKKLDQYIT